MTLALTPLQRAPYMMEVHELAGTLLRRLTELEAVSEIWKQMDDSVDEQLAQPQTLAVDSLVVVTRAKVAEQTKFFDLLEAFLAAWARLSLLLFPNKGDTATLTQRNERAEALQQVLDVPATSPLADRELRNAWMHFDERLDEAIVLKTYENRHRFVRSALASRYIGTTCGSWKSIRSLCTIGSGTEHKVRWRCGPRDLNFSDCMGHRPIRWPANKRLQL